MFSPDHIQFEIILSDSIEVVAKSLTCRDWVIGHNKFSRPYLHITEEIVRSVNMSISGIDYLHGGKFPNSWIKKAFFIPTKPLILVKRTRYKNIHTHKMDTTHTIIVYRPGRPLPEKSKYFDLERKYTFNLKYWNMKTAES